MARRLLSADPDNSALHLGNEYPVTAFSWIFDFDAGAYRRVSGQGWTAHWLADGRRLILGDWERISLLDTLTGESRDLFSPLPDRILLSARPAADDSMLVFTRVTKEADIWLMTFDEP